MPIGLDGFFFHDLTGVIPINPRHGVLVNQYNGRLIHKNWTAGGNLW